MLNYQLIEETYQLIQSYVYETPLDLSVTLKHKDTSFYFKNEGLQHTRSFKMRGAFSKLLRLTDKERQKGIVAISSGNHGIAVAYAAKTLGIENALIFVPENTPKSKTDRIAYYGAKLIIQGKNYDEAHAIAMNYIEKHEMVYIDGWDKDPYIYAGQGTVGYEIVQRKKHVDTIVIPIGGGGLITGIATAIKYQNPDIRIIGVQTEACPAMKASLEDEKLYHEYPSEPSICEALVGGVGQLSYSKAHELIDDILIVKENTIRKALKHMLLEERRIIEASSCVVIAALWDYPDYDFGKESVLVLSGNNIDMHLMKEIINQ